MRSRVFQVAEAGRTGVVDWRRSTHPAVVMRDTRIAFRCLVGFVATQGFLIPVAAVPSLNWALWPSLPDLWGYALIAIVALSAWRRPLNDFDRGNLVDLAAMGFLYGVNLLLVTIPESKTGAGLRFGGFSLFLTVKYIAVYWAVAHVPLSEQRVRILRAAAFVAFFWIIGIMFADRYGVIEIDTLTAHLPSGAAGKWSTPDMSSTVGPNPGHTSVALLVLTAFILMTSGRRNSVVSNQLTLALGAVASTISGSRQGVVRFAALAAIHLSRQPRQLLIAAVILVPLMGTMFVRPGATQYADSMNVREIDSVQKALDRQRILLSDPFSNEGLSGRPLLWLSVLDTLNEKPRRWIIGYGVGNYAEHNNAAHSMPLSLLQDGGVILLFLVTFTWLRIFRRVWRTRTPGMVAVALTGAFLASSLTANIFTPNLSSGWYLGMYYVMLHIEWAIGTGRALSGGRLPGPAGTRSVGQPPSPGAGTSAQPRRPWASA
jgi:hypothetical protein